MEKVVRTHRKLNVLVLGVGGNVSLGILKALAVSSLDYRVVGACISKDSLGLYLCDTAYISPYAEDKTFFEWLINICRQEKIDIVITGVEEIIDRIATDAESFRSKTSSVFVFGGMEQLEIGRDKLKTCEWLKKNGCAFPLFAASEDHYGIDRLVSYCGFPLIAKPRIGKGSQAVRIINGLSELNAIHSADNYVIEQYIGNEDSEYTIACYCDKAGRFVELIIMKRSLYSGMTIKAEVVKNETVRKAAVKICEALHPVGPLNIQMRLNKEGKPICFELNVRFSGTTPMRARFGFNDVEALIREHIFDEDIHSYFDVKDGCAYRYWNEFYIDGEDYKTLHKYKKIDNVSRIGNYVDGYRSI